MSKIEIISSRAQEFMTDSEGSHDWDHTLRVVKLAKHIAQKEKAHLRLVKLAAYLHDIGRKYENESKGEICHAEKGAEIARQILKEENIDKKIIEKVTHIIRAHRFRNSTEPDSLEAKVLYDADKLDSIGAVGIGRAFLFAGEIGAKLHDRNIKPEKINSYSENDTAYREYLVKLSKIKDRVYTEEGQRLAKQRHRYMSNFFKRLNKEVQGII